MKTEVQNRAEKNISFLEEMLFPVSWAIYYYTSWGQDGSRVSFRGGGRGKGKFCELDDRHCVQVLRGFD